MALSERDLAITVRAIIEPLQAGLQRAGAAVQQFGAQANAELKKVEDQSKGLNETWNKLFKALIGIEIINQLKNLALSASNANEALAVAADTAANLGHALDRVQVQKFAEQFSTSLEGGGFALDKVIAGIGQLVAAGANGAQAERLIADATNLAAARHMDLDQAVHLVQMAMTGHVAILGRYGIATRDAAGKTFDFAQIMDKLEQAFHGDAAERARSLAGQLGILSNLFVVMKSQLGMDLLPIMTRLVGALDGLVQWFRNLSAPVQRNIVLIGSMVALLTGLGMIIPAVVGALESVGAVFGMMVNPLLAVMAVLYELQAPPGEFADAVRDAVHAVGDNVHALAEYLRGEGRSIKDFFESLALVAGGNIPGAVSAMTAALAEDKSASLSLSFAKGELRTHFGGAIERLKAAVKDVWTGIAGGFMPHITIPHPAFTGLGGYVPGSRAAGAGRAAGRGRARSTRGTRSAPYAVEIVGDREFKLKPEAARTAPLPYGDQKSALEAQLQQIYGAELTARNRAEALRDSEELARIAGTLTPEQAADFAAQHAQLEAELAGLAASAAEAKLELARLAGRGSEIDAATKAYDEALGRQAEAVNKATEAHAQLVKTIDDARFKWSTLADELLKKLNVPGLKMDAQTGHLAFSWLDFLAQAVERTKAYADIQRTVTGIMRVVAQVLDVLRPVIDLFLRIIVDVVNVFVLLWNTIARILRLLGIHIAMLDKLNTGLDQVTAPLIRIVHDIPTLNELAGKTPMQALVADSGAANAFQAPVVNAIGDLKGGLLNVLGQILGAVLALKLIFNIFGGGGGGGLIGTILGWLGIGSGGGGLIGTVLGWLGLGSSTSGMVIGAQAGLTAGDMSAAVSTGVQDALDQSGVADSTQATADAVGGKSSSGIVGGLRFGAHGFSFGNALIGLGAGTLFGDLMGGGSHTSWGDLGGLIGSFFGPVGAIAGGLIGSFFGHKDNPAQMPDKYDTVDWGQGLANFMGSGYLGGPMTANGQQFVEDPGLFSALGNKSMIGFIDSYIAKYGTGALSSAEAGLFAGMGNIMGGGIIGGKNGMLELANGQWVWWQTLLADAKDAIQRIFAAGSQAVASGGADLINQATHVNSTLVVVGNELAGTVKTVNAHVAATIPLWDQQRKTLTAAAAASQTRAGALNVHHQVNIYGDVNGIEDVEQISLAQAEATARTMRVHPYLLNRIGP